MLLSGLKPGLSLWALVVCGARVPPLFVQGPFVQMASAGMEPHECVCIVCLRVDSDPPPIQSGCACRSDTGLGHVGCLIERAVAQQPQRGSAVWWECQTRGQQFTLRGDANGARGGVVVAGVRSGGGERRAAWYGTRTPDAPDAGFGCCQPPQPTSRPDARGPSIYSVPICQSPTQNLELVFARRRSPALSGPVQ